MCIDFPGAEGVYVVSLPVYRGERLTEKVRLATDLAVNNLAEDAGRLVAEKRADRA